MSEILPNHSSLEAILPSQNLVRQGYFSAQHTTSGLTEKAACMANCSGHCSG